jgi:subtilase family serine protease
VRRRLLGIAAALAGLGALGGVALALAGGGGSVAAAARAGKTAMSRPDRYLGRVAPAKPVEFALTLKMKGAALERYATSVGAGARPALSAGQIGRRFGLSTGAFARVQRWLEGHGIQIQQAFPQRTQLLLRAPAASVERLFGVGLGEFSDAQGTDYHRPLGTPVIPAALRSDVIGATQLNTKPIPVNADVPAAGLGAQNLSALYDLGPLINQDGLTGAGQTIAVFSEDTFQQSDIDAFDSEHGISGAPPVQRVDFEGNVPFQSGDGAVEVDLDIETIQGLAPQAQIIDYEAPCCGVPAFSTGIDKIVSDGRAKLVNFSYGYCELLISPTSALRAADQSFAAAAAAGVTVFVSSGDEGSYACQRYNPSDHRVSVGWPGSSPNVVSVGGTYVDVRQDGTRLDEAGWEEPLIDSGGGGGLSAVFSRPSWQTGVPGINNKYSNGKRQVPDVSAVASPFSGYAVFSQGQNMVIGGTSASAPFWTGSFALIDQLAQRQIGRRLPFVAPLLYEAAAHDPNAFYDVTLGGNRLYPAGPGWDYSTGLGTPNMAALAGDVISLAR